MKPVAKFSTQRLTDLLHFSCSKRRPHFMNLTNFGFQITANTVKFMSYSYDRRWCSKQTRFQTKCPGHRGRPDPSGCTFSSPPKQTSLNFRENSTPRMNGHSSELNSLCVNHGDAGPRLRLAVPLKPGLSHDDHHQAAGRSLRSRRGQQIRGVDRGPPA